MFLSITLRCVGWRLGNYGVPLLYHYSLVTRSVLKLFVFDSKTWCHIIKLFVFKKVTQSYICLLSNIVISIR